MINKDSNNIKKVSPKIKWKRGVISDTAKELGLSVPHVHKVAHGNYDSEYIYVALLDMNNNYEEKKINMRKLKKLNTTKV